jgi:DNA adenine methylase
VVTQGRGGTMRPTCGWRHYLDPGSACTSFPSYLDAYRERLAASAERLLGVTLECLPALEIIDRYGQSEDALLYVDPPYLGSTRTSTNYAHDMPRADDHQKLAEALRSCGALVVLSGYPSAIYDELYGDWYRYDLAAVTAQGNRRSVRTEVLWSNRPIGERTLLDELTAVAS